MMTKPTAEQVTFLAAGTNAAQRTALDKMREMVSVKDFGAVGDDVTDDTAAFDAAIAYSQSTKIPIFVPRGTYRVRGIDLKQKSNVALFGESSRELGASVIRPTGAASIVANGRTAFVRINDATTLSDPQTRGCGLYDLLFLEDSASTREIGVIASYAPQTQMSNVVFWGFNDSVIVQFLWNTELHRVQCINFRDRGFCFIGSNINGISLNSCYASTNQAAAKCNFDFFAANSVHLYNVTTEGSAISHFRVNDLTQEVAIYGIHLEGGKNIIEFDVTGSTPTDQLGCNFAIYGGFIYGIGSSDSSHRFVKYTGSHALGGMSSLALHNTYIHKSSALLPQYLDLSRVANFSSTATFERDSNASIDALTWNSIGSSVNQTYARTWMGHNGLVSSTQRNLFASYAGQPGTYEFSRIRAGTDLVSGQVVATIPLNARRKLLEINVLADYNVSTFASAVQAAQFVGAIAHDGTLSVPAATVVRGTYAVDTTFAYNPTTGNLTATNTTGFGNFNIRVRVTEFY